MNTGGFNPKLGSDSQDSDDIPPGTSGYEQPVFNFSTKNIKPSKNVPPTPKGVEQAKKRLRAFSIQKKTSLSPVSVPKPLSTGSATVFIGKAAGLKTIPKPEVDPTTDPKKPPKPPKPGAKQPQESYINTQKKTLAEIEDMKRKMELVELGIPLGLICPAPNSDKAMPTKAMPPIKTFLDSDKVDQLIREAKQARVEGKEFKFDYRKLLPDYANPFQRNKGMGMNIIEFKESPDTLISDEQVHRKSRERDKRKSDKIYEIRRHSSFKIDKDRHKEDKYKDKSGEKGDNIKERDKSKETDTKYKDKDSKFKDKDEKSKDKDLKTKESDNRSKERDNKREEVKKDVAKDEKEAHVDLKDFVICDSWSDNEEKSKDSTPKVEEIKKRIEEQVKETTPIVDPMDQLRESLGKKDKQTESPKPELKRLNPVIDSYKFEIEEPDEDVLDMFAENYGTKKYSKAKKEKELDSPDMQLFDFDDAKESTFDGMAEDTFLESVINEIKQDEIDETSQDKGLVEYDESPSKDGEARGSVTPEMDDRVRQLTSSRSEYSDGYKSTESGYKSTESLKLVDYKSNDELERIVEERQRKLGRMVDNRKLAKYTVDSLETWSFVLKICQPLLFRHDRNKCYKETRIAPKLWFTENPKLCNCVKDRRVVYEELEMCKMELVDSLYREQQAPPPSPMSGRGWYPRGSQWAGRRASEWETEDSQHALDQPATPDLSLDKEYQRFMEAVWPEVAEPKSETPRSTPVRQDKKKAGDEMETQKKAKKLKTSSEGWSQESDMEEEVDKSYKTLQELLYEALHYDPSTDTPVKKVKSEKPKRKRKLSTSTSATDSSESDAKKRKKMQKKKEQKSVKKTKLKNTKRRRVSKKNVKKLKEKLRKKKKIIEIEEDSDLKDLEKEKKKKERKIKKKKQLKQKKKNQKKKKTKARSSSSSDSSSDSESEPERKSKKKKKNTDKKKKHKKSLEEEELFDVNILKNIKTEKETDEEKHLEFSPRRQKPREIINVKELQNDFVGNSIQIKKEVEKDEQKNKEESIDSAEEKVQRLEDIELPEKQEESRESQIENMQEKESPSDFREQEESQSTPQLPPDESNQSQCSSQESIYSLKDQPIYEKDESHLRPSSQNSNYSFHDVMASGMYTKNIEQAKLKNQQRLEHEMQSHEHDMQRHEHDSRSREIDVQSQEHDMQRREHDVESLKHDIRGHEHEISRDRDGQSREHESQSHGHEMQTHEHDMQSHEHEMDCQEYEHGNYEMYEQMAMAYQSDVASQHTSPPGGSGERRIETVVRARSRGEIKCDWRAGDGGARPAAPRRPSRWGLKPGDVNIVLTSGEHSPASLVPLTSLAPPASLALPASMVSLAPPASLASLAPPVSLVPPAEPVYKIQSLANRTDNSVTGYDEAYMDMYGAADKLQYGDCFSGAAAGAVPRATIAPQASSLDRRIDLALRTTVLGEVAKDLEETDEKDGPEKGILVTKSLSVSEGRGGKRVSFADGYKPGQDSDVEEPPVKKRRKVRRRGCAWPCPAAHADHVPLWDALPPPPPPPGSPPPPARPPAPPAHLLRGGRAAPALLPPAPPHALKFDPNSMPAFMPPEPPPGLISFQNL